MARIQQPVKLQENIYQAMNAVLYRFFDRPAAAYPSAGAEPVG